MTPRIFMDKINQIVIIKSLLFVIKKTRIKKISLLLSKI